jgi:hypothetical protein
VYIFTSFLQYHQHGDGVAFKLQFVPDGDCYFPLVCKYAGADGQPPEKSEKALSACILRRVTGGMNDTSFRMTAQRYMKEQEGQ